MHVLYNGIYLEVQRVLRRDLTYVLDPSDQDYLYERHVIDVIAVYHANRTSYAYDPATRKLAPTPGVSPGLTDVALRSALAEPRKPLYVYSGDELVLAAPRPGQSVDANNGPKPRKHDIVEVLGRHTFLVRFSIEACVRECPPDSPITQYILSSRYETSHDVDPQHRTVITTSGVTLFRTDLLAAAGLQPDHFRSQVIPPIPLGFQRKAIKVTAKPARNALVWSVVDREEFEPVGDPNRKGADGKSENAWGVIDFQAIMTGATPSTREGMAAGAHSYQSCSCRAVGGKTASRWALTAFCLNLCVSKCRLGMPEVHMRHMEINHHLHDRIVEMTMVTQLPPPGEEETKAAKEKGLSGISLLFNGIWRNDQIEILARKSGGSYQPPNDSATRGTYGYEIVAGAFADACKPLLALNVLDPDATGQAEPSETGRNPSPLPPALSAIGRDVAASGAVARSGGSYDGGGVVPRVKVSLDLTTPWPIAPALSKRRRHWYVDFQLSVRYDHKSGKLLAPVALPMGPNQTRFAEPTIDVLQVHAPYTIVGVDWKGARTGSYPEMPNPQAADPGLELLDHHVALAAPRTLEGGRGRVYAASGHYTFVMAQPPVIGVDPLEGCVLPFLTIPRHEARLDPKYFVRGLIDAGPAPAADPDYTAAFDAPYPADPGNWKAPTLPGTPGLPGLPLG